MQQRNLGSEVMVAVGAVLIIAFGLLFAILLSSSPEEANGTAVVDVSSPTVPAEQNASETPLATEEANASDEPLASEEASPVDEPTATDEPSEEASPTDEPTVTENEPTARPTATEAENAATNTSAPSIGRVTRAPRSTATEQEAEPTATNTLRPSATATNTPRPSRTPRPSETPSPTNTQRPTATSTSQNAITGIIPTPPPSPTVPPLSQPTRTPSSCQLPSGWTTYTVLAGNTLFAIALATNSTVDELRAANCIENIDNIQAGDVVFVPRAPLNPVATFVNSGGRPGLNAIGCQNPNVQITSPITSQRLNGTFTVYGSAARNDFLYYKIEVRPDAASIYNFYLDSRNQVRNGVLGEINSELFGSGLHWLKLTVVDLSAAIPADATCEIPVIFE